MMKTFAIQRASGGSKLSARGGSNLTSRSKLFSRFAKARDGVAAVEFALLAPLLVTMMLGSIELTHALWGNGKLAKATSTVVNLIALTKQLDNQEFDDLLAASPLILQPYPINDLAMTVTSIVGCEISSNDPNNKDMKYLVRWSRSWTPGAGGAGSPHQNDTIFAREPDALKISDGDTIIVAEGTYTYYPKIARKVGATMEMADIAFQQPRETIPVAYPTAESNPKMTCEDYRSQGVI